MWNEPNHAAWFRPAPDPERYGRLLDGGDRGASAPSTRTRPCCRQGSRRRRAATRPGCSPTGSSIALYDTGAMDAVDAIAYHPYSFPYLPSQRTGDNGFIDQLRSMREVMVDHDDDKRSG